MMSSSLIIPKDYQSKLSVLETQKAIKLIKDTFEKKLAENLNLMRVSAPLFVSSDSGLNDNLNGVERPIQFDIKELKKSYEIVHSLAKWKRQALKAYGFEEGCGLYTDMNAIRRDEEPDHLHSVYVDQWDWEKIISRSQRNMETLQDTVKQIIKSLKETEKVLIDFYPQFDSIIDENVTFITSQELEDMYPEFTSKERENAFCRLHHTVFISQIGKVLKSGQKHDGRAPDYDDWQLNGDILIYDPILDQAVEISSMGIRVDEKSLMEQLEKSNCQDRETLPFHASLLKGELPLTMGGGIGQSRLCMLLLQKAHIGEVQASSWSDEMIETLKENNIHLL